MLGDDDAITDHDSSEQRKRAMPNATPQPTEAGKTASTRIRIPGQIGAILTGALLLLGIGGIVALSPWLPSSLFVDGQSADGFILVLGWIVFVLGIAMVVAIPFVNRRRWLVVDDNELRYEDPRMPNQEWRASWPQLDGVHVTVAEVRRPGNSNLSSSLAKRHRVRLVLSTRDESLLEQYGTLRAGVNIYGPGTTTMVLGDAKKIVPELANALARHGGAKFAGVRDEGQQLGPL